MCEPENDELWHATVQKGYFGENGCLDPASVRSWTGFGIGGYQYVDRGMAMRYQHGKPVKINKG